MHPSIYSYIHAYMHACMHACKHTYIHTYCLWGNALKRSPGIIRKSRVSYPGPGFLSSATWPSLPKKHCN